jgi:hypothetical protein
LTLLFLLFYNLNMNNFSWFKSIWGSVIISPDAGWALGMVMIGVLFVWVYMVAAGGEINWGSFSWRRRADRPTPLNDAAKPPDPSGPTKRLKHIKPAKPKIPATKQTPATRRRKRP